jgi:hypothetical protein
MASVACAGTALVGLVLGIYAGLVPSIQFYLVDQDDRHTIVLGNVGCFLELAVSSLLSWPLPLLHGRKPYMLAGLALAMPLLFPQALAVMAPRSADTHEWQVLIVVTRTLMGVALGFAASNFHSMLTDVFGASLMSTNPHQEAVDASDVRRHGGGMGVWLGLWTWSWIGTLPLGFLVSTAIIDRTGPAWGFVVSIVAMALMLVALVATPETRRSGFRQSVAEVRRRDRAAREEGAPASAPASSRAPRGPKWWGQEVWHGALLSLEMLRQPGFALVAVYGGWIYAQTVLVIVFFGSLASREYQ